MKVEIEAENILEQVTTEDLVAEISKRLRFALKDAMEAIEWIRK